MLNKKTLYKNRFVVQWIIIIIQLLGEFGSIQVTQM